MESLTPTALWTHESSDSGFPSTSRHRVEDALSKMLPKLWHLDLTSHVKRDSSVMSANGGYCDVFLGHVEAARLQYSRARSSTTGVVKVAIKRIRARLEREKGFTKALAREIGIWARLDHENILPFLGYMIENDYPSLVSEWIEKGTLREYMQREPDYDAVRLALGIAKGLEYLHNRDIVHSDLKGDNILISQAGEPLICDFGISRMLDSAHTLFVSTTHNGGDAKGSTRWMAIELHLTADGNDPKHSKETDIWAYGMTLYEIISKEVPYSHLRREVHIMSAVMKGELPALLSSIEAQATHMLLWSLCTQCWETCPVDRPIIDQIVSHLQQHHMFPQYDHPGSTPIPPIQDGEVSLGHVQKQQQQTMENPMPELTLPRYLDLFHPLLTMADPLFTLTPEYWWMPHVFRKQQQQQQQQMKSLLSRPMLPRHLDPFHSLLTMPDPLYKLTPEDLRMPHVSSSISKHYASCQPFSSSMSKDDEDVPESGESLDSISSHDAQDISRLLNDSHMTRKEFTSLIKIWWFSQGAKLKVYDAQKIIIGNRNIDIYQLYMKVLEHVGISKVAHHDWIPITAKMGWSVDSLSEIDQTQDQIAEQLEFVYELLLESFHQHFTPSIRPNLPPVRY